MKMVIKIDLCICNMYMYLDLVNMLIKATMFRLLGTLN